MMAGRLEPACRVETGRRHTRTGAADMVLGPAFEYEIEHQWRQLARLQEQAGWQRAARLQRPAARRPLPRLASRGRLWAWLPLPRRSPPRRRPALSMQNTQPRLVIALPS